MAISRRQFCGRLAGTSALIEAAIPGARAESGIHLATRQAVAAAGFFAARSSPGSDCSFAVGLSDSLTGLVTADLGIAAGLSVAAAPDLVVAAAGSVVAAVGLFLFVAGPVCSGRSFAAATGKGRADLVSYSLVLRFSFLRNRNCLLPLYFEDRA